MTTTSRGAAVAVGLAAILGSRPSLITAQRDAQVGEWRVFTGDPGANRYSALSQIDRNNVNDLIVAWRWPVADRALQASNPLWRASRNEETPIGVSP
jgi:glucose dehydrogenase